MNFKDILKNRAKKSKSTKMIDAGFSSYDVLQSPIVTEKTYIGDDGKKLKNRKNVYVFRIPLNANKNDVKYAIKYIYNITVLSVRTRIMPKKSRGRGVVRKLFKKAAIVLPKGEIIDFNS